MTTSQTLTNTTLLTGKIHWAKHSRFQPYEVFCGNIFTVPWPAVIII